MPSIVKYELTSLFRTIHGQLLKGIFFRTVHDRSFSSISSSGIYNRYRLFIGQMTVDNDTALPRHSLLLCLSILN